MTKYQLLSSMEMNIISYGFTDTLPATGDEYVVFGAFDM